MFTWIKRLTLSSLFLALIATNVLTLTHATFNAALSGLMGTYLGVRTVSSALQAKLASKDATVRKHKKAGLKRKAATRKFGSRLARRTQRVVGKSLAAIPAESVPFVGVAVLIADTSYELYEACETMRDLDDLYAALEIPAGDTKGALHGACNPRLPEPGEVWNGVVDELDDWWEKLVEAV